MDSENPAFWRGGFAKYVEMTDRDWTNRSGQTTWKLGSACVSISVTSSAPPGGLSSFGNFGDDFAKYH